MQTAQSIGLVEQRLSSLSHFVLEAAELIPGEWEILGHAAAQKLTLSALAHRLSAAEEHDHHIGAPGEMEFF